MKIGIGIVHALVWSSLVGALTCSIIYHLFAPRSADAHNDVHFQTVPTVPSIISNVPQPNYLTVFVGKNHDKQIVLNFETGAVTLPPDMPLDEAARGFWEAVRMSFHVGCQAPKEGKP